VKEVIASYIGFEVLYFRRENFCNIVLPLVNTKTITTTTKHVPYCMMETKCVY